MKFLDQIGRELAFNEPPVRVVSLVPSITELAFDLGFKVVGKTKFCVHPSGENDATIIGGTKNVNVDLIKNLDPDLVLANKEENTKRTVDQLLTANIPTFVSEVSDVESSLDLIKSLGLIGHFQEKATDLIKEIKSGFASISLPEKTATALYLIWQQPYMAAGTDTYISDVMSHLGIENSLTKWGDNGIRYPKMEPEQIRELYPDVILLSSEPFPFGEKHLKEINAKYSIPVYLVDGESFSWYGSRPAKSLSYLKKISRLLRVDGEN